MNSIQKTIAILVMLLLATSFVLGNIFADYKAKSLVKDYKTNTEGIVRYLEQKHSQLIEQQEFDFVKLALRNSIPPEELKPFLERNGIYLLQVKSTSKDTLSQVDWEYLLWLESQRRPERKIFHLNSGAY